MKDLHSKRLERRLLTGGTRAGARQAAAVDENVAAAVRLMLDGFLDSAVAGCRTIDETFARDIAERLARFTLDGGKRMRSQLLWWGFRAGRGPTHPTRVRAALRCAAGLELIQTCALVHDDVMDHSATRRGAASVHADLAAQYGNAAAPDAGQRFGRAAAVLVGDLALAWADDLVAGTRLPVGLRDTVYDIWRAMRTEMAAGQYLDLTGQVTASHSAGQALRTARLKSALYSVQRPLLLGAALAGADRHTTRALESAGLCAGLAFQLRDDLLGVFGDPEYTGKQAGEDITEGKATYLMAIAWGRAGAGDDRAALSVLERALGRDTLGEEDLADVRSVLESTGARAVVDNRIRRLMVRSEKHLAEARLESTAHRRLRELLDVRTDMAPVRAPSSGTREPKRSQAVSLGRPARPVGSGR